MSQERVYDPGRGTSHLKSERGTRAFHVTGDSAGTPLQMKIPAQNTYIEIEHNGAGRSAYVHSVDPQQEVAFRCVTLRIPGDVKESDSLYLIDEVGAKRKVEILHVSMVSEAMVTTRIYDEPVKEACRLIGARLKKLAKMRCRDVISEERFVEAVLKIETEQVSPGGFAAFEFDAKTGEFRDSDSTQQFSDPSN